MARSRRVLVVDDDPHIREVIRFALDRADLEVIQAADGREALLRFEDSAPDLLVLDILMPEMDGIEVCREIRTRSSVPVVFLSSQDDEIDRVVGLEIGGDDYVTKPFSPRELVARVKAVLRRAAAATEPQADAEAEPAVTLGRLTMDPARFKVTWDGREVVLTVTEFGLLLALLRHPGRVYSRSELMERAYREHAVVTERTIDSHVRRVRSKLAAAGGAPVETVHGVGYRLGDCEK